MAATGDTRSALTDEIAARARAIPEAQLEARVPSEQLESFLSQYYAHVPLDDLRARSPEYLARAALAHWALGHVRDVGSACVRVHTPTRTTDGWEAPHTLVEIVNDDMPFLIDSVTMTLERHDLGVHLVVHPVLHVRRDADGTLRELADGEGALAESWLHFEIDRETDAATLERVRFDVACTIDDVRATTRDWQPMLARLRAVVAELHTKVLPVPADELAEGIALLEWMADQHFTLIGYRAYDLAHGTGDGADELRPMPGSGLGVLRGAPEGPSQTFANLPPEIRAKAHEPTLLVLSKANARSTVHRPTYLDYVGVKRFDEHGAVVGEHRFLGLFTSGAYNKSVLEVPVLRRKVAAVVERAGFRPASHDHKDLLQILETYPRDDLFQTDVPELYDTTIGILQLQERRRVRLFVHREPYGRFVSCLVFVPRDRYTTAVRERVAGIFVDAFHAESYEWNTRLSTSVLARLHYVMHLTSAGSPPVDLAILERQVAAATRSWADDLRDTLGAARGEEAGRALLRIWGDAFPAGYQDDYRAAEALADLGTLEKLTGDIAVRLARTAPDVLDLKVYGTGDAPSLSNVLPRLVNMGVEVEDEHPYTLTPKDLDPRWIKHFRLRIPDSIKASDARELFEEAFLAVMRGDAEDDGFNRLVLGAGLAWREVALLRAYSRYLRQAGTLYSQRYIEDALATHPEVARRLVELFVTRLDPIVALDEGGADTDRVADEINAYLDRVSSLDEDRILRALMHLVLATLRTNWFQTDADGRPRPCLVCKLDPVLIPDLPLPRPMFEIYVYSPRVEGVHLRAGKVARGGIRWSDRREDFRTEVLGLMKAQRVKNVVIVPGGAKGGFVVKQPPADPAALRAEVEACYRLFIAGLLDVTDNLVEGAVVPPAQVVRYDGDDPYLVVAADKGTATFSDVANEIAVERGFWLGDAFASGGSAGYDHKEMGITARGAWESVKRHFRQVAIDPDQTDFTVVGVGDMSGDVFGNGMLLSHHIRLVAAFDHRHVFLDPNPDPEASWIERKRLFEVPRSSWGDYDSALISSGGGVYPRAAKSIPITPEVRLRLGIADGIDALTPAELIRAILCAPVDLFYNGGIGTYVKARTESHADVGDKANDLLRVNGAELRCRVVGEGGNLGFTQRGRVEYALADGMINTDAIDNSAGVDTSDHEVNIKILLDEVVRAGALTVADRNELLASMTDEVAELVLRDNYRQNRALANARAQAVAMEDVHARYIRALEQSHQLNRAVEYLPDEETLTDRHNAGVGLTSPELAVLLAYAKITVEEDVLASPMPDDGDFLPELVRYFPTALRQRYLDRIRAHPLAREIITTALVNGMVNRAGTTFAFRLAEETGASAPEILRAHEAARAIFDQESLWHDIEVLDGVVAADTQTTMYLESRRLIERASRWLLRKRDRPLRVAETVGFFAVRVARLTAALPAMLRGTERDRVEQTTAALTAQGVPIELAARVAALDVLSTALDITDLAETHLLEVERVAELSCIVGDQLRLDWLADRVVELPRGDRWQALARNALREDVTGAHRAILAAILETQDTGLEPADAYAKWTGAHPEIERVLVLVREIETHGVFDLAVLSVALRELRNLA